MGKFSLRIVVLTGAGVACAFMAPLAANSEVALPQVEVAHTPEDVSTSAASQPVQLVTFDYQEFFDRATQLGMLSQTLGYTLTVAPDGKVTDCALARRFRSPYIVKELCEAVTRNVQLHPARDAQGNAISGIFTSEVRIYSYFAANR